MRWHLGTIGFSYKEWQGVFYPPGMPSRQYLAYYAERFNSVEIDTTFYGIPRAEQLARWAEATPDDFTFCLKTPQVITHDRRLVDADGLMADFLDVARTLGPKLGPFLIQLPPDFTRAEAETLDAFLDALPADLRYGVEFRHASWETPQTAALLSGHGVCWVTADYIHLSKRIHRTTDFLFFRWLGKHGRFKSKNREQIDTTPALRDWWAEIRAVEDAIKAVYGFFNNDFAGYAPATCNRFKNIIGLPPADIRLLQQGRLL